MNKDSNNGIMGIIYSLIKNWGWKITFSFIDQGAFSGANFTVSILLARWLTPDGYGAFAVAYAVFLFISGIQTALILEPMVVFGPTHHYEDLPGYLTWLMITQFAFTVLLGILLGVSSLFVNVGLKPAMLGMAISCPFIFLVWLIRQACYLQTRPNLAMQASLVYAGLLIVSSFVLHQLNILTPFSSFLLMGISSVIAIIVPGRALGVRFSQLASSKLILKNLFFENWGYGKWLSVAYMASWIATSIYIPMINIFSGFSQAAAFRTMQNLTLPLQQAIAALCLILIPYISRKNMTSGSGYLKKMTTQMMVLFSIIVVGYTAILLTLSRQLVNILYVNSYYQGFIWLLPVLSLSTFIMIIGQSYGITLRVMEQSRSILQSKLWSAGLVISVGIFAMWQWGLVGVLACLTVSGLVEVIVARFYYLKKLAQYG